MLPLSEFFAGQSPLLGLVDAYRPRQGQAYMAEAVAEAIAGRQQLIVEAGTGTGKTFAYLLPALLSGARTIVSTGTKALQDQLYHRDLPILCRAVGRPVATALLKGRANYLCLHRLDLADDSSHPAELARIREWRYRTVSGDRAELADVPEDSPVWPQVTSTAENCLGQQCPQFADCFVARARKEAQEADLVVVNHHLLLADLAMREEGFVEFLPNADAVILDEAHQLPDLAVQFFGLSVGSRELERLVEDARAATLGVAGAELTARIDRLQKAIADVRIAAPAGEGRHELGEHLGALDEPLKALRSAIDAVAEALDELEVSSADVQKARELLDDSATRLATIMSEDTWDALRWLEVNPRSLRLHLTPLDVAPTLSRLFSTPGQAWILTSATLAVGEDFSHFTSRTGLAEARALQFPSPYAIADNGLLYLPEGLPSPSAPDYTEAVLAAVAPMFEMTDGGIFLLFTSHRALNLARRWLRAHPRVARGRKLLAQGTAPRNELLQQFRRQGNAVLLGTSSFWEGVDVRGPALTIVAIDKLPFASPADPLLMARLEHIRRNGGNGFTQHQVPQAVLALKQGAGRLLRDDSDYGVVVLCDPRVREKAYGRRFVEALAPMPVTQSLERVAAFLAAHEGRGAVA